jgi:hypothetical protein
MKQKPGYLEVAPIPSEGIGPVAMIGRRPPSDPTGAGGGRTT